MPFGCVVAALSYHRCIEELIGKKFKSCIARYVDLFFGAATRNVRLTGGLILSEMCALIGTTVDAAQSADELMSMVVLGICTSIALSSSRLLVQVDASKAERWKKELEEQWAMGILPAAMASKFAGRFSFCSSGVSSRCGRTYVRAFYAQANAPCEEISPWLSLAMKWWHSFLVRRPPTMLCALKQRKVVRA